MTDIVKEGVNGFIVPKRDAQALALKMQTFIDEAILLRIYEVQILHGKGTGALRQVIRDYLSGIPEVSSYQDEHVERGGHGITLVRLDF